MNQSQDNWELKHTLFWQPDEENISHSRKVVSPRFLYLSSLMEKLLTCTCTNENVVLELKTR